MVAGIFHQMRGPTAWLFYGSGLFLAIYLASWALASYMADPEHLSTLGRIATPLLDESTKATSEWIAAGLCFALALAFPRFRFTGLGRLESAIGRFALHRWRAVLLCGSLPVIVRLALLPVLRVPEPLVADEFGYLLLANTFASGRLANPTHPLWKFFETIYVLHQPAYASIYPIAPAIPMAVAEVFGATPWVGVCLAAGLMCALICWMLQAWVPPKWALLGGLLAACRFTIVSPWMNTYWGGAIAAIGGALVLGALPRIMKHRRVRDSLLFGLGLAILAQSRPYEGVLFSIPLVAWLAVWLIQSRETPVELRVTNVVLPVSAVVALLLAGTALYNWRVTGNALLMPYALHQKIYGTPQPFYWQPAIADAPGVHHQKDIEDVFHWQLEAHDRRLTPAVEEERLLSFWRFYLQPLLTIPLLFLPLLWRDRRLRVLFLAAAILLAGNSLYPFFIPHYAAPLCGLIVLLIVWGLRCLSVITIRSYRIGLLTSRALVLTIGLSGISTILGGVLAPWFVTATDTPRIQASKPLGEGKHVVFVHYGERHSFHAGIVFNDADIDKSQIVWARDLGAANEELIHYYRDRDFWVYSPDVAPDAIALFVDQPYISGVTDGAGRRDDVRAGVSPGSIAVLWGGNFPRHGATGSRLLGSLPVHVVNVSPEYGVEFGPGAVPLPKGDEKDATDDLSVQFDGHHAAVLSEANFSGQESIAVQVPFEAPTGLIPVTIRVGDFVSTKRIRILPAAPGVFQMRMSDSKLRGIVLRSDGSFVDLEHPAHRGDVLRLFATGLGPLNAPVRVNGLGAFPPVTEPAQPLIIGVANRGARMISAKYTASMVGVVEITFEVPLDTPPGADVPLSVAAVVNGQSVYSNKSSLPVQ